MALSSAQKLQFLRLPVVDASVTSGDKYAFLGVFLTATIAGTLTSAQRRQILRLPVVDASVTSADKFALLGLMQSADSGARYSLFETSYFVDPTWLAYSTPQTNVGSVLTGLAAFGFSFSGIAADPAAEAAAEAGTTIANSNAVYHDSSFLVCMISGRKVKRDELVQRYDGVWCLPEYNNPRHPQELIRSRSDKTRGSVRPEAPDRFVGTISASDL